MSQPFDRGCFVPPPGKAAEELGEFWDPSPWTISQKHNLSAYERNRAYLNIRGETFLDISYLTGADSDGDARCSVAADVNGDGMQELIVRQISGGPLAIYKNQFPAKSWLKVSLRGVESNSLGIGAKLTLAAGDVTQIRELYPVNSYRSQALSLCHFGLGEADKIEQLTIHWPSGKTQEVTGVTPNQHIVVREGTDGFTVVVPGEQLTP